MTNSAHRLLLWSPRILGILVALFLGVFAFDVFSEVKTFREALLGFLIHLAPTIVLLLVVAASWRREWIGGVLFIAFAVLYAVTTRRIDWILIVAGPLFVVGVLFLLSWRQRRAS